MRWPPLSEAPALVDQLGYLMVHAPRQTGKSTALIALARALTASGRYAAVYLSCEAGEAAGDDLEAAERIVLSRIRNEAALELPRSFARRRSPRRPPATASPPRSPPGRAPARGRWW
jgi:hypothetical protein